MNRFGLVISILLFAGSASAMDTADLSCSVTRAYFSESLLKLTPDQKLEWHLNWYNASEDAGGNLSFGTEKYFFSGPGDGSTFDFKFKVNPLDYKASLFRLVIGKTLDPSAVSKGGVVQARLYSKDVAPAPIVDMSCEVENLGYL